MNLHQDKKIQDQCHQLYKWWHDMADEELARYFDSLPEMTPIEQLLLFALLPHFGNQHINAQVQIESYRADFVVTRPFKAHKVVVECDGHDFHEKTKEQAARDKQRDRRMQALGYKVLRFTGSEIWSNTERCAQEICDAISKS